jgi:NADPH:quinone reductase-like Zn-dependent oxidoreductase
MKAIVMTQYGAPDVLQLKEIDKPAPKDNEILVRVRATSVGYGDTLVRRFNQVSPGEFNMPFIMWFPARIVLGLNAPKQQILGSEFAGQVEAVGKDVTRFKQGDPVFGYRAMNFGANAEYLCMPESGLVAPKPDNITDEQAAAIPYGALTALNLLRKVKIEPGHKVLVNGASGSIGAGAVQLAKYFGAEVTGVCGEPRLDYVKALGADHVIDYTREDFTQNGQTYDLIVDVLGRSSFSKAKNSLKPDGRLLYASFKMGKVWEMLWTSRFSRKKVICALSSETLDDLLYITKLIQQGVIKSVVDRCYPLEQAAAAHHYVESGDKRGSVVITV